MIRERRDEMFGIFVSFVRKKKRDIKFNYKGRENGRKNFVFNW